MRNFTKENEKISALILRFSIGFISLIIFLLMGFSAFSQSVGISATGTPPDVSSMLDVAANDKGMLIPRMTSLQRDGITTPANGLMIYNTNCGTINYYDCDTWRKVGKEFSFPNLTGTGNSDIIVGKNNPSQNESGVLYMVPPVNGATNYIWTLPSGASIASGSGTNSVTIDFTTPGVGFICVTAINSCLTEIQTCLYLDICPLPTAPVANAGTDLSPTGFTANWTASNDANKYYLDAATDIGFTSFIPGYQNLDVGNVTTYNISGTFSCGVDYYYRIRSSNDCGVGTNSNIVTVNIPSSPTTANAGTDQTLSCDDDFTSLAGNTPIVGSGTWTVISGTATITNPNSPTTTVTGLSLPDNVTLRWTIASCSNSTDDVVITTSSCCTPAGPYAFTNCTKTGNTGPSQGQCDSEYGSTTLDGDVTVTSGIQEWTVPTTGTYEMEVAGASSDYNKGAIIKATLSLTQGDVLKVLVGQKPGNSNYGAAGGSFVALSDNTPLIVAGGSGGGTTVNATTGNGSTNTSGNTSTGSGGISGGGGSSGSSNTGGGAGFVSNGIGGASVAYSFINGGNGSGGSWPGGFGGGNTIDGYGYGGGGGGYSGGGGGGNPGGGGGSFIAVGATDVSTSDGQYDGSSTFGGNSITNLSSYNSGHGYVTISLVCP